MAFPSTFLDIQNAVIVKARLEPTLDLSKVKDWINQVYYRVCIEAEVKTLTTAINCVNGTATYTLSALPVRILQMVVQPASGTAYNAPMIRTTLDEILQRRQAGGNVATGPATHYALLGTTQLEVWPTPSAADVITVYYVSFPAALSANSDVPIIEEPYASKLLEYGALIEAGDFKGDPSTSQWQANFEDWMQRFQNHMDEKQGKIPGQFHQWGDGDWDPVGMGTGGYY